MQPFAIKQRLASFWILTFFLDMALGSGCSWSNEGCHHDEECCSKSCHKEHEGTNSRCRHSSLGEQCVNDYHCQDGLECGSHFNCCSPYWEICTKDADCCESFHVCRGEKGFYYDRCLYPSRASRLAGGNYLFSVWANQLSATLVLSLLIGWRLPLSIFSPDLL